MPVGTTRLGLGAVGTRRLDLPADGALAGRVSRGAFSLQEEENRRYFELAWVSNDPLKQNQSQFHEVAYDQFEVARLIGRNAASEALTLTHSICSLCLDHDC